MKHVKHTHTHTQKQDIVLARSSRLRAIERIILESEWTRNCNKHFHRATKPSDLKPYEGIIFKYDSGDESSDGEEVFSEVSDFQILQMMMIIYSIMKKKKKY